MPLASHPPQLRPRYLPAARRLEVPRRRGSWFVLALGLLAACSGPKGATPIPEPPSIDPSRVDVGLSILTDSQITVEGQPGAASRKATIRATNLDSTQAPAEVASGADGSFTVSVELPIGAELRLEPLLGEERGAPHDWLRTDEGLVRAMRHECFRLPGVSVLSGEGPAVLEFENACSSEVTLSAAGARLSLGDFTVELGTPVVVAPGTSGTLQVRFERQGDGVREDTLFFGVAVDGVERRHPVTLFAPER